MYLETFLGGDLKSDLAITHKCKSNWLLFLKNALTEQAKGVVLEVVLSHLTPLLCFSVDEMAADTAQHGRSIDGSIATPYCDIHHFYCGNPETSSLFPVTSH